MSPRKKITSKRIPANHRYKIEKRVKDHHRKLRKDAKNKPNGQYRNKKDPGIPNNFPGKEKILQQIADEKLKAQEEKDKQKEIRRKAAEKARKANKARNINPAEPAKEKKAKEAISTEGVLSKAAKRKATAAAATSSPATKKTKTTKKAAAKEKEEEEEDADADAPYNFAEHFVSGEGDEEVEEEEEAEEEEEEEDDDTTAASVKASLGLSYTLKNCGLLDIDQGPSPTAGSSQQRQSLGSSNTQPETHFGFQNVPENMKEALVKQVFASVATNYDIMNDVMSGGVHRLWKDHFIRTLAPTPGTKLLDVAGGTGDIAMRFLDYCKETHGDNSAQVTVFDINPNMLQVGQERFAKTPYHNTSQVSFMEGNAENLEHIPDNSMDAYTIAFGIRNCTHVDRVLKEAHRVLKPGGRFMCLEFSKVENPVIAKAYDVFSFDVIPTMGQLIANDRDSYQYLVESIRKFPPQKEFAKMIKDAGFTVMGQGYEDLTFGVAAIHSGFKL
ncbi:2-hexaprenyl-6-methoxy-1,4-benzoquinone methyltransferase [Mortierella alpina]|uniref:2-methoxy-6-polyprenyl-1,4-benzoquinol methylase, mitochondrial n=1 Tax=Mortierella alpina TaxID=64518 RepID=A0A9P6IZB3_MORAP|nr:2-hexaprenyl-6-methoxy-1,4-benzoquinone methyltransferase [Mortierella alpina]